MKIMKIKTIKQTLRPCLLSGLIALFFAMPCYADTITIVSDSNTLFSASGTESLTDMNNSVTTGSYSMTYHTFEGREGTGIYQIPGTQVINSIPHGWWYGVSGYYETSFILPVGYTDAILNLQVVGDDGGYAYLNHTNLGSMFYWNSGSAYSYSTSDQSLFHAGTNLLTFAVSNWGAGPTGLSFRADIEFTANPVPTSPVPEPETYAMLLAGLGLLSFTARRRKQSV